LSLKREKTFCHKIKTSVKEKDDRLKHGKPLEIIIVLFQRGAATPLEAGKRRPGAGGRQADV
jgi:hypothetical protein